MRHIIYSMQFKGSATPAAEEGVFKTTTSATSCALRTVVGPDGVQGTFAPAEGDMAFFESEVRMLSKDKFAESGVISFGDDHTLRFTTIGEGHVQAPGDSKIMTGAATWSIEGGEGQFEGASGYITSNFLVNAEGELTDYHFGLIFLK